MEEGCVKLQTRFGAITAFMDDKITDQIIKFGNHTRPEFAFATSILQCNSNIFDIGAHIGTFSLIAMQKIGHNGKILSVEGNSNTFPILSENVQGKSFGQSVCDNSFLSVGDNYAYIANEGNSGASHLVESETSQINSVSIDKLVDKYFAPTYIKIDIEGQEYAVLSSSSYIKSALPMLYIEINDGNLRRANSSAEQLSSTLGDLGYRFFLNVGDRNAPHDLFVIEEFEPSRLPNNCDVLAVHRNKKELTYLRNNSISIRARTSGRIFRVVRPPLTRFLTKYKLKPLVKAVIGARSKQK